MCWPSPAPLQATVGGFIVKKPTNEIISYDDENDRRLYLKKQVIPWHSTMLCTDESADLHGCLMALGNCLAVKDRGHEGSCEGVAGANGVHDRHPGCLQEGDGIGSEDITAVRATSQDEDFQVV